MLNFILNLHVSIEELRNGGLMALHKLAYDLASRGHNVYIFTKPYYEHSNIKVIPSQKINPNLVSNLANNHYFKLPKLDMNKTVSIYAEIQKGNPYGTKHNVRWVLYDTNPNIEATWGRDDVYFNYGTFKSNRSAEGILTSIDYNLDKLYDEGRERKGFCYILHKNTPQNYIDILSPFKAVNLTGWQNKGYDFLRQSLNKYEYLLMFDHKTFNSTAALLCGTKVINIFLDQTVTPKSYRKLNPIKKFGLAYGISDISHANATIHLARPHIEKFAAKQIKTIDNFVQYWQNKLIT